MKLDVPMVFVDETSTKILLASLYHPRTGVEISRLTGIALAETFARLKILQKKGLLDVVSHRPNLRGLELAVYQASFQDAYIFVENGKVKVRFQLASCDATDMWGETTALL